MYVSNKNVEKGKKYIAKVPMLRYYYYYTMYLIIHTYPLNFPKT